MEKLGNITLYNADCMEILKQTPDNFYSLALVDPPYGIGEDGLKNHSRDKCAVAKKYTPKSWDKNSPDKCFFDELIRVSKNQIIFGANHFISKIPYDSSCWIVWDKDNTGDFADCELAWYLLFRWGCFCHGICSSGGVVFVTVFALQVGLFLSRYLLFVS